MSKIELESEGVFCPQCGSAMKQFGPKSRKQYRCLEDPEHYATDNKIKTFRRIVLK
jgi:hypothetical protein